MNRAPLLLLLLLTCGAGALAQNAAPITTTPIPAQKPGFTLADLKAQLPQNKDGNFVMQVPEILNTSTDAEVQSLLAGQVIETVGQVMREPENNAGGNLLRITRSQILCCSSHSRQCSVALEFSGKAPELGEMAWVTLTGVLSYRREERRIVPVITVRECRATAAPAETVLR